MVAFNEINYEKLIRSFSVRCYVPETLLKLCTASISLLLLLLLLNTLH